MPIFESASELKQATREEPSVSLNVVDVWKLVSDTSYIEFGRRDGRALHHPSARMTVREYLELLLLYEKVARPGSEHELRKALAAVVCTAYPTVDFTEAYSADMAKMQAVVKVVFDRLSSNSVADFIGREDGQQSEQKGKPSPVWFGRVVADLVAVYGFPHSDVMDMEMAWFWNYVANMRAVEARRKLDMVDALMAGVAPMLSKEGSEAGRRRMDAMSDAAQRGQRKERPPQQDISDSQLRALSHDPFMGKFIKHRRRPRSPGD